MARVDAFGFVHPTAADPITAEGMLHIDECGECRINFPEAAKYIDAARASLAREG